MITRCHLSSEKKRSTLVVVKADGLLCSKVPFTDVYMTGFHPPGSLSMDKINYSSLSLHFYYTLEFIFLQALFPVDRQDSQIDR